MKARLLVTLILALFVSFSMSSADDKCNTSDKKKSSCCETKTKDSKEAKSHESCDISKEGAAKDHCSEKEGKEVKTEVKIEKKVKTKDTSKKGNE